MNVNPIYCAGVERVDGITKIHMTFGTYYTTTLVETVLAGLDDVHKLNNQFTLLN